MPTLENMIPGGVIRYAAAYGKTHDISALTATAHTLRTDIVRVVRHGADEMRARADAAIPAHMGLGSTNRRNALSENAIGRVLYLHSNGNCKRWEEVMDKSPYTTRMKSPDGTPDFIYQGRILDSVSSNFSAHPSMVAAGEASWRNRLLPSVKRSIESKWHLYGDGCIAAVDITSYPAQITTAEVVAYLRQALAPFGGRNAFLIRGEIVATLFQY